MTEPDALFVYGTLMFPEVLEVLLGRTPEMAPAALDGWRAAALADRVYPGLVAATRGLPDGGNRTTVTHQLEPRCNRSSGLGQRRFSVPGST